MQLRAMCLACAVMALMIRPALADAEEAAIAQVHQAFETAFSASNLAALEGLIDNDAIWFPPGGQPTLKGKAAVVEAYASRFGDVRGQLMLDIEGIEIADTLALLHGRYARQDVPVGTAGATEVKGYYMMVFRKQPDGGWKIARDMWNESPAAEGAR